MEKSKIAIDDAWIKANGIPLNIWNEKAFMMIGSIFGGLIKVEEQTKMSKSMKSTLFKVKGAQNKFFPAILPVENWGRTLRLLVEACPAREEPEVEEDDNDVDEGNPSSDNMYAVAKIGEMTAPI
ncbi:hypothetical protein Syun_012523 [Stephania yunnanensis]|uniref:DUF4283 domain-containing protein n=1 Tax=Stephania yunnanensis TaxID=152371 RepID=A0AAP0PFE2_9MAGN